MRHLSLRDKLLYLAVFAIIAACGVALIGSIWGLGVFLAFMGHNFTLGFDAGLLVFYVSFRLIEGYWWEPFGARIEPRP